MTDYVKDYFQSAIEVSKSVDYDIIEQIAKGLAEVREQGGRLFIIGVGGSAANCSHAVNDFRKLANIETYSPADNVSELTARTNDEGWDTVFAAWLNTSKVNEKDAVLVFSVGGGNAEKNVSPNIVKALDLAKSKNAKIYGVVGRDGGHTKKVGDAVVIIPTIDDKLITPLAESFQAVVWHCIVCHPAVAQQENKWESIV